MSIGVLIGWILFADKEGYAANLFTEGIGVIGTFFVLDWWTKQRDERLREDDLKAQLIREMGGPDNALALRAVRELRARGWLEDSSLQGQDFFEANLKGAMLRGETLIFRENNDAYLAPADLRGAYFQDADLEGAILRGALLQNATFFRANLTDAFLVEANMEGADLLGANLMGANLKRAKFDTRTVLPYGENWSPDTDMGIFTDVGHPDFYVPPPKEFWDEMDENLED